MSYRKGKCNTCGYLQSSESEYMKPYCTCHKKVMKERNKIMKSSLTCPLCGVDSPHVHSPLEQLIFKNGVKSVQPTSQDNIAAKCECKYIMHHCTLVDNCKVTMRIIDAMKVKD